MPDAGAGRRCDQDLCAAAQSGDERIFVCRLLARQPKLSWSGNTAGPKPLHIAYDHFRFVVFENPDWDPWKFDIARDVARADEIDAKGAQLNASDPNLDEFRKRGGKLLTYHGWSDGVIPAQSSIDYFESVLARDRSKSRDEGLQRLQKDVRLLGRPCPRRSADEVGVLLVGQGLDGRGVEALAALLKGQVDGELADDGLARAGGRGDEHALTGLQGLTGLDLEGVQVEFVHRAEGGQRSGLLNSADAGGGIALSGERSSVILLTSLPVTSDNERDL